METYNVVLLVSCLFGIGLFFTPTWSRVHLTLHRMEALEEGGSLLKTAAIGAGLGAVSALVNSHVGNFAEGCGAVLASSLALVHGRVFTLAAYQVMKNPKAWYAERFVVDHLEALASKQYAELYDDPVKLQAYLDKTYGKDTVKVASLHRALRKANVPADALRRVS